MFGDGGAEHVGPIGETGALMSFMRKKARQDENYLIYVFGGRYARQCQMSYCRGIECARQNAYASPGDRDAKRSVSL